MVVVHAKIQRLIPVLCLFIPPLLFPFLVPSPLQASDTRPAIVVNGESVPMVTYERKLDSWMEQIKKRRQKQSSPSSSSPSQSSPEELRKHTRNELVKHLVNRLVIETHAKRASIPVSEDEINREWSKMAKRYGGKNQLRKAINKQDRTIHYVRNQLKLAIKVQKFIDRYTPEYNPSEKELRTYYDDHPVQFKGKSFSEVKQLIRSTLQKQKKQKSLVKLIEELRNKSDIRVNV